MSHSDVFILYDNDAHCKYDICVLISPHSRGLVSVLPSTGDVKGDNRWFREENGKWKMRKQTWEKGKGGYNVRHRVSVVNGEAEIAESAFGCRTGVTLFPSADTTWRDNNNNNNNNNNNTNKVEKKVAMTKSLSDRR